MRVSARRLEDGPEVVQLVEQVPDVVARAVDAMRVEVGEARVVAVAVEGFPRRPFDQDQDRAGLSKRLRA
jgi:hypothetical protein